MNYKQNVKLKNINFEKVSEGFHDIKFVEFLTQSQPVKIIEWTGIQNGRNAHFKLWFFGWRNFKVSHEAYKKNNKMLYFIDRGIDLPFGLSSWEHQHIVEKEKDIVLVKDIVNYSHPSKFIGILLYPMLVFPIIIRKILYKLYFRKN